MQTIIEKGDGKDSIARSDLDLGVVKVKQRNPEVLLIRSRVIPVSGTGPTLTKWVRDIILYKCY